MLESLFNKVAEVFKTFETLTQVFSCEICEIFQNTFFYRTPLMAASEAASEVSKITLFLRR